MPKSSRHKSHKQSKHSSRDYSDSEEDVVKMKEKRSRDAVSTRGHRDSASGDKRKTLSLLREGKDSQDLSGHGNGDVLEYVSSKRRKEKNDANVGGDRWNGGGDERVDSESHVEKESRRGESLKVEVKLKENISKGEILRVESKSKSKRHDSGIAGERKEDSLVSDAVMVEKEDNKTKGESKRKSERDSLRKEGKESKGKDHRSGKEKKAGQESKSGDTAVKLAEMDVEKKQGTHLVDLSGERQSRRSRENNELTSLADLKNHGLDKDIDKKVPKRVEGSGEREKYYDESKDSDERRVSSKGNRAKDSKHRDDKHKDGGYPDKYQEDGHKDDRRRDDKYWEVDKDNKLHDEKYREDGERDSIRRDDRSRVDGDRDGKRKDEKQRDDRERDSRRRNDKYHEVIEREDKYHEDNDRDRRQKDDRSHEEGDKDIRRGDEKYYEDGDRDDRRRDISYKDDGDRDYRLKNEKNCEDMEREVRYKDSKQGDGFDRKKRPRDSKYRDERASRDRAGDMSDPKRSRDDGYAADYNVRKSSAYDDSPPRDDRATRYRDDQDRRRSNEKEDYSDVKSRGSKDQRSDAEKNASSVRMDPVMDRVRSTSRNVDMELTSGHGKRRRSPTSSSHAPRDNYRAGKQDDSKYKDYSYDDRSRHNMNSTRDYSGHVGVSDKTSSPRSVDKLIQKDNANFGETERHLKSDIHSPPLKLLEKSPSSYDRRQFTRPDTRRNINIDESTQRSGASRDRKDVHPAEELVPADADAASISSPFGKNSHNFSSNSKSFPPPHPPFRTGGVDSPSLLGSGEDDSRSGKPNIRHRRMGDHNMGRTRMQENNNAWRGVPSWPSPVPNGFLPFPHAPPFHPVMQPFHAPSMFGVRPSMELNLNHHHSPYHMPPDTDRFSGAGLPMGWRNQVDPSFPPQLHGWETQTSTDLWKGQNRTESLEMMHSSKKETNNNTSIRTGDEEALGGQTPQNEQTRGDHESDSISDVAQSSKSFANNKIGGPAIVSLGDSDVAKVSKKDDVPFFHFYLSKLDVSAELAEPELYDKCTGLIDTDEIMGSAIDDSKILYMEGVENKTVSPGILSFALSASTDDSVFTKSMSLYKTQRENFPTEYGEKLKIIPNSNHEEDKTENLGVETLQEKMDGNIIIENPVSVSDLETEDAEDKPLPEEGTDAPLGNGKDVPMGPTSVNGELKSLDTKYGPLLNSEAMVSESVNLSRIHHSPESTH